MQPTINLSQITDLQQLKALAYDQIAAKEQAENYMRAINTRIAEVMGMGEQFKQALDGEPADEEDLGIEE